MTGFTYLGLLFMIAIIGISLAAVGEFWHTLARREKEKELLFAGDQFRQAIAEYYASHARLADRYPHNLSDLLKDPKEPAIRHYLRQIYLDPMTGKYDWGLLKNERGGIMGVFSLSNEAPQKIGNFRGEDAAFAGSKKYSEWKFAVAGAGDAPVLAAAQPQSQPLGPLSEQSDDTAAAAPVPVATPRNSPVDKSRQRCEMLLAEDGQQCAQISAPYGGEREAALCRESAAQRNQECNADPAGPFTLLYIPHLLQ